MIRTGSGRNNPISCVWRPTDVAYLSIGNWLSVIIQQFVGAAAARIGNISRMIGDLGTAEMI